MYRTGDLAYWIEPGLLGYAGRSDAQLKIRGVRVEPAEVEAVLNAHPAVQESGVTAQRYPDQDNRLVAYASSRNPPLRSTVPRYRTSRVSGCHARWCQR